MTRILDLPTMQWDFTVWNNEDWADSSYQYLDGSGALVPFDGIALQFTMRRSSDNPLVIVGASTTGLIDGVPVDGIVLTEPGAWGLSIPRTAMLRISAGNYVCEVQAMAERAVTIGFGGVTVKNGVNR